MPRRRHSSQYRKPTRLEKSKIYHLDYELDSLFTEDEIIDLMDSARLAIAGEFYFAKEKNPRWRPGCSLKPYRGTDHYVIGVGGKSSELAQHVSKATHRKIVHETMLPEDLLELSPKHVMRIVLAARMEIILNSINVMRSQGELRYDEGLGTWNIIPSCIDEYRAERNFRREAKKLLKFDDRAYHGRPRRDRGKVPGGVSVSLV